MIFNIIILVLIGVVAYFHYVQGFFSATFSAVIAIAAAVMFAVTLPNYRRLAPWSYAAFGLAAELAAKGTPIAFETKGIVRLARGLTSST